MYTRIIGKIGEKYAQEYLKGLGYVVIHKNYYQWANEIDLICKFQNQIVFVEVKTSTEYSKVSISQMLSKNQIRKLNRAINYWLLKTSNQSNSWRLDFIGIKLGKDRSLKTLDHYKNI